MELKDITVAAELETVRGGNAIVQNSVNGPVTGLVGVHGSAFNLSPVSVTSDVLQQNSTTQGAAIDQLQQRDLSVVIDSSQLSFGGWWSRVGA